MSSKKCRSALSKLTLLAADADAMRVEKKEAGERLSEVYLEGLIAGYRKAMEMLDGVER